MIFDIKRFLYDNNLLYTVKEKSKYIVFSLKNCIFDENHINNDAAFIQNKKNNIVSYKCFHDSCSNKSFKDVIIKLKQNGVKVSEYFNNIINDNNELKSITLKEIIKKEIKNEFIIDNFISKDDITIIYGPGGSGKSFLSLIISLFISKKQDCFFYNEFTIPKVYSTLFLQSENSINVTNQRAHLILKDQYDSDSYTKNIHFAYQKNDIIFSLSINDKSFNSKIENLLNDITKKKITIDVLIIDPLISFLGCDENDASSVRMNLDLLNNFAVQNKLTIICLHHTNKIGDYRGSTAIRDWARNMIKISLIKNKQKKNNDIKIEQTKSNNFELFEPFIITKQQLLNPFGKKN